MNTKINHSRHFLTKYGSNIAGGLWMGGNLCLTSAVGLGGTWNESAAGVINVTMAGTAMIFSNKWFGFPLAASQAVVAMAFQQGSHLLDGNPIAWTGYGILILGSMPSILEPWIQKRFASLTQTTETSAKSLFGCAKRILKRTVVESRRTYSAAGTICLLPFLINDVLHDRLYLLPVYGLWLGGNAVNAFARPVPSLRHGTSSSTPT